MRATGNNTRITVDLSTSINNTLASPGDVGLNAVNNGVIDLNNFITILTGRSTGNTRGANALIATNGGRININAGANITTEGTSLAANGVQRNNGLSVELDQANSSQITTYGLVRLEVNGRDSRAVNATGNNTNGITINDDIDIVVRGTNIRAFHANDGARIIANGLTTVRHEGISDSDAGTPSIGIYATETPQGAGSINLNDLELTTLEDGVPGVVANSFFGLSIPTINLNGKARITTLGARANAVVALNGGRVSMNEGHILANGEGSIALLANLDNSQ
ncbi:MAG TPA: hypothetical protein DCG13_02985, partial [Legionellales bacterium]|nr:hypothetical protein [Legionellales bacterium]